MAPIEPLHAADYDDRTTEAVRSVLLCSRLVRFWAAITESSR